MDRLAIQIRYPSGAVIRTWLGWFRPSPDPRQGDLLWINDLDVVVTVIEYHELPVGGVIVACPTCYVAQA